METEAKPFPHRIAWLAFLTVTLTGAGLHLNDDPAVQAAGLVLLLSPLFWFTLLMLVYYVRVRRHVAETTQEREA